MTPRIVAALGIALLLAPAVPAGEGERAAESAPLLALPLLADSASAQRWGWFGAVAALGPEGVAVLACPLPQSLPADDCRLTSIALGSEPKGAIWEAKLHLSRGLERFPVVAADETGRVWVAWQDRPEAPDGGEQALRVTAFRDGKEESGARREIKNPGTGSRALRLLSAGRQVWLVSWAARGPLTFLPIDEESRASVPPRELLLPGVDGATPLLLTAPGKVLLLGKRGGSIRTAAWSLAEYSLASGEAIRSQEVPIPEAAAPVGAYAAKALPDGAVGLLWFALSPPGEPRDWFAAIPGPAGHEARLSAIESDPGRPRLGSPMLLASERGFQLAWLAGDDRTGARPLWLASATADGVVSEPKPHPAWVTVEANHPRGVVDWPGGRSVVYSTRLSASSEARLELLFWSLERTPVE